MAPPPATATATFDTSTTTTTGETTDALTTADPDETSGTTTTTGTTDPTASTTEHPACVDPDMCGGDTPYCLDDACVPCTAIDCAALDPNKPACHEDLGVCVECVDDSDCPSESEPFCDPNLAICQPCSMHEHCPETACNLETGVCFPADSVLHVERSLGCDDGGPGTEAEPLCRLMEALSRAVPGEPLTIKVKQGLLPLVDANVVTPGTTVAVVANGLPPTLERDGALPALDVTAGSTVFVDRIWMTNQALFETIALVQCTDATLWLERTTVFNAKTGVRATNCDLGIRRSVVCQNATGGVDVTSQGGGMSRLLLENSFITDNGETFGLRLSNNSFADVVYSTFAGNGGVVSPIACAAAPAASLTVRNSLLAYPPAMFFVGCELAMPDTGNVKTTEATPQALIDSGYASSYEFGVLRAKVDGKLKDQASASGTPVDFDGDPRPSEPGAPDYAGGDVPAL